MSARSKIVNALVTKLKTIDGSTGFSSNLFNNVFAKLKFWDEVDDYPSVYLNASQETREYLPGGFKWAYLIINIRIYVQDEEPEARLEEIFEDIEKIIDENGHLEYETNKFIEDIRIMSLLTDEGLLTPIGVGEVSLQVMYDLDSPC
jgi:hypothetical protein